MSFGFNFSFKYLYCCFLFLCFTFICTLLFFVLYLICGFCIRLFQISVRKTEMAIQRHLATLDTQDTGQQGEKKPTENCRHHKKFWGEHRCPCKESSSCFFRVTCRVTHTVKSGVLLTVEERKQIYVKGNRYIII